MEKQSVWRLFISRLQQRKLTYFTRGNIAVTAHSQFDWFKLRALQCKINNRFTASKHVKLLVCCALIFLRTK